MTPKTPPRDDFDFDALLSNTGRVALMTFLQFLGGPGPRLSKEVERAWPLKPTVNQHRRREDGGES